jgi:hypothetical protein
VPLPPRPRRYPPWSPLSSMLIAVVLVLILVSVDAEAPAVLETVDSALRSTAPAHRQAQSRPPSAAVRATAEVLEETSRAEARAIEEAVAADAQSRADHRYGGSDSAADTELDDGKPRFRSFSELYQWAVKASTGGNGRNDRTELPSERQKPSRNLPAVQEYGRSPLQTSRGAAQRDDEVEPAICPARPGKSGQNACDSPSRVPGLFTPDAPALSADSPTTRLQDLQRIADDLPEFEGEIVLLERSVAMLRPDKQASDDERIAALETIEDLCHSGDNGRDLHVIGGLALVVSLLNAAPPTVSAMSSVPEMAAKVLATCARNNPPVADAATDVLGAVPLLLDRASAHDAAPAARARALMALASLADAAPSARRACAASDRRAAQLISSVRAALEVQGAGTEENRAALRALALAETVVRAEGSTDDTSERWRMRMLNSGIVDATRSILESGQEYSEDTKEAAARLATVLGI